MNYLGSDDLAQVLGAIETISSEWILLFTKLGLKINTLSNIASEYHGDNKMCLNKALIEWLKLNYDHKTHGRPSWKKLAEVVKSHDYSLFETIANRHQKK